MKQMMDIYFVLKNSEGRADNQLLSAIERCGLKKYTTAVMYIMKFVFGLNAKYLIMEPDAKLGSRLLEVIMEYDSTSNKRESAFARFFRISKMNLRLIKFSPWEVFWTPLWRIRNWVWMRVNGYAYHD